MTELEIMERAKMYVDKMANGIDPISDTPVREDDCINQVRISRCLFYISDVLRKLIENGGSVEKPRKTKKDEFHITKEQLAAFRPSDAPLTITELANSINALIDLESVKKLKTTAISSYLLNAGFLKEVQYESGKVSKRPTAQGEAIGILVQERMGYIGLYYATVFNAEAQQFVVDNIDAIIEASKHGDEKAEQQGKAWTQNDDEKLAGLFRRNTPVAEIAAEMQRSEGGVRSRLKRLGLIENRSDAQ